MRTMESKIEKLCYLLKNASLLLHFTNMRNSLVIFQEDYDLTYKG
jgi:hypothetical protein